MSMTKGTGKDRREPPTNVSRDEAINTMLGVAREARVATVWDRHHSQQPQCTFGQQGVCCRLCKMGPCRVTKKAPLGICGANVDTIVARNLLHSIVAGTAAHSEHARGLVQTLRRVARGQAEGYGISDPLRMRQAASALGVSTEGRGELEIAGALAELLMAQFAWSEHACQTLCLAPAARQALWSKLGLAPTGVDGVLVEMLHRTNMGVDHNYRHLVLGGLKASLADGWVSSLIATTVSDILFGTPRPVVSRVNLGVLSKEKVNIVIHGHDPTVAEMVAAAADDPALVAYARERGAAGINVAGICCTANEVLMRHGLPIAGNFLQQELAILTGAVELMVVDVQCVMPSLPEVVRCFHTKLVSTSEEAVTDQVEPLGPGRGPEQAAALIRKAADNFPRRDVARVNIPGQQMDLVAGFSNETIFHMLGGRYRGTFRPLNDAIIDGRIRGIVAIIGCSNPRFAVDDQHVTLATELIKRNVLVLQTGCSAIACAKAGLLIPEAALEQAGESLREVCEAVGIPPLLHMGSCVDNSRILVAVTNLLHEGGLGQDLSDLPVAGAAPEWMSDKAVAIGHYFVASGIYTVLGHPLSVQGSEKVDRLLREGLEEIVGGRFEWEPDPLAAADKILRHIEAKRDALGINAARERKLFDMQARRAQK